MATGRHLIGIVLDAKGEADIVMIVSDQGLPKAMLKDVDQLDEPQRFFPPAGQEHLDRGGLLWAALV